MLSASFIAPHQHYKTNKLNRLLTIIRLLPAGGVVNVAIIDYLCKDLLFFINDVVRHNQYLCEK